MVGRDGAGAEDTGVTMLLIVGAMKFGTFVIGVSWGSLSTDGAIMMGTVGAKVISRLTLVAPSLDDWA